MVDPKQMVADGYDRLHGLYADWSADGPDGLRHRYIDRVLGRLGKAARTALDLGCGTGRHATAYLLAKGLDVTGVDISPASVETATKELPGARVLVGDMATIDLPEESFDLVTAFYSLIHVPKEEHGAVLRRVRLWLRPGGYLVVTVGAGLRSGESLDPAWLGAAPMFWSGWDADASRRLIKEAGFEELSASYEAVDEHGQKVVFLWIVARRPA